MRHQASRTTALMLGVLLLTAAPVQAGTITFRDLVRSVGASGQLRPASEVRLRLAAQSGAVQTQSTQSQGGATTSDQQQAADIQPSGQSGSTVTTTQTPGDPSLSQSGGRVETVDLGDVTGTVCDCGIVPPTDIPKAGFPWWPLLGGAVVPFLIPRGGEEEIPPGPPPPTPPPPQVPEPMSLLLFGSGLLAVGAGARRRHGRKQLAEGAGVATTEEV